MHKKSPPTQRYFHKLPLSGLRNTNKTNNFCVILLYLVMKLILFDGFYAVGQSSISSESSHSVTEHFSRTLRSISIFILPQTSCTLCLKSTKPFTNFSIRLAECSYAYQCPFSSNRYAWRISVDSSCRMSFGVIMWRSKYYFKLILKV